MSQQIRFCSSSDNVRIAYSVTGQGPPLVKAANWLSHLEFDWNSPVWRHWLVELSRNNTLVRYDERGCGLSDWDVEDFSVEAWVHDLETVVDTLGLKRFPLLGISQGGPVAIVYAVRHPEKVSHLILYGSYLLGWYKRNLTQQQAEEADTLLKMIKVGWGKSNPAFRQVFTTLFIPGATAEQIRWFNDLERISTSPENAYRFETTFYSIDVSDYALKVKAPTLVLHAREDAMIPFSAGRKMATHIPGARFVPLEGQNHVLMENEPAWGRFLAEVRSFLGVGTEPAEQQPPTAKSVFPELTPREQVVLELIAQGLDNAQISKRMVVSQKTVRNHITHIFRKLMVRNRAQAIVLARQAGMGQSSHYYLNTQE
jgi:pimeloyl-ACP methyl ester carboxylesterase/DNA-binding CsgD family transcriptional regulator